MVLKKSLRFFLTFLLFPINIWAYSDYIIASGENIGIQLNTNGVMVVGFYKVQGNDIASASGLEIGDVITNIDNKEIDSINDLVEAINKSDGEVKLSYIRNDITKYTNLKLYKDESNQYKTGIYVKDSISGIGTLTFIDPNTKLFGALGHEIADKNTGKVIKIDSGKIYASNVTYIKPSTNGSPGEKNAQLFVNEVNGNVFENTIKGIFGNYTGNIDKKLYKVAKPDEIKLGNAQIMTVLEGETVGFYDINILKLKDNQKTKNILFEITDKDLLEKTNGIVQGMSGSPIIQGDNIIGAVTHVVVDNPTKGYGIFITNMLEEAEN